MPNKILVALDRSDIAQQVFEQALILAKATKAELLLLHVLFPEEEGSPRIPMVSTYDYYPALNGQTFEIYQNQWDNFKAESLKMLQNFAAQANTAEISTEFTQTLGNPSRTICKLATTWGADLIVMGHRGLSGFKELLLGSVSNYVLHHAPCSVHIVRSLVKPEDTKVSPQQHQVLLG